MESNVYSRRAMLQGVSIAGAGIATIGACAGAGQAQAAEADGLETRFDADILVVGGGLAGLSAGIKALELGAADVLLIDKQSGEGADYGGSSLWTGGNYIYPDGNTDEARAQYLDALYSLSEEKANYALLEVMVERSWPSFEWIMSQGVEYADPTIEYPQYDLLRTRKMTPGQAMEALVSSFKEKGGRLEYGVKAQKLLIGPDGVAGVLASGPDGSWFNISAGKTLLCTGGYVANTALMEEYVGEDGDELFCRAPYSATGDGIAMVKDAGGYTVNIHGEKTAYICGVHYPSGTQPFDLANMVAINVEGRRFFDESTGAHSQEHGRRLLEQPTQTDGLIADSKAFDAIESTITRWGKKGIEVQAVDTLEEAAAIIGCPVDAMLETIAEYNEHVVGDHTEGLAIEKNGNAYTIDTPPYYVFYPLKPGCSHAFGGVVIDEKTHVLQPDGTVIRNLYAAGEVAGGLFYGGYMGGTCTSRGVIFGTLAAETALSE